MENVRNIRTTQSSRSRLKNEKFKVKYKKILLVVTGIVGAAALTVSGFVIGNKIDTEHYNKDVAAVDYYENQKYLRADLPDAKYHEFYNDYEDSKELVEKLPEYVEVSKKLHNLGLSKHDDITYFDDAVVFLGPIRVLEKIEEYKKLSNKVHIENNNKVIGDDVIKLNHLAYELKELEKMYNKKIFDGYTALEEYGLASTKSYLADLYGGDPSKYEIKFSDYQHDGGIEITGPGIKYGDRVSSEIYDYLYAIRNVYKAENATISPMPEEYNRDRNNLVLDTIKKYNIEGADIISDIERQNKKK